jgi:protein-tyrosine phosphatase
MFWRMVTSRPKVDIHSHLVPGVDDGVNSVEESLEILMEYKRLGFEKVITTPHISGHSYPNTPAGLRSAFQPVLDEIEKQNLGIRAALAAEYYVDEALLRTLQSGGEVLSWNGYMLIETSFGSLPLMLEEVVNEIRNRGLQPVLAHPERYAYLLYNPKKIKSLRALGLHFQLTAGSLVGRYGERVQAQAEWMLSNSLIEFIGSDTHKISHLDTLHSGLNSKAFLKYKASLLRNDLLI